jgi:hypothetical protein
MMTVLITALFTRNAGDPALALALADIDFYLMRRNRNTGVVNVVWAGLNPTGEIGGGLYIREYSGEDFHTYSYYAYAHYTGAIVLDSDYSLQKDPVGEALTNICDVLKCFGLPSTFASTVMGSGSTIRIYRGDTWTSQSFTLGDVSARSKVWLTVKRDLDDADAAAVLQIEETDGLTVMEGIAQVTPNADASVTILNPATTGDTVFSIVATQTSNLRDCGRFSFDIQVLYNTGVVLTLFRGDAYILADSTRAVS